MSSWKGAKFKGDNFEQGAEGAFNVSWQVCYCDKDYILEEYKERRTAPDGRLVIAELRNKEGIPPSFLFRWDEKDDQLDVDIQGVSETLVKYFKKGKGGYKGHYPPKVQSDGRVFEVDIHIPDKHIFCGYVKFNVHHMAKAAVSIGNKISAGMKVTNKIKSIVKGKVV